jgi:malate synthase
MRRDEYEEIIRRLKDENRQLREEVQNPQGAAHSYYKDVLKDVGLEVEKGVVRYSDSPPNAPIAPTWAAQRAAQTRSYEDDTCIADIERIAERSVEALITVHNKINANAPMHPALENGLREFEDAVKNAGLFRISQRVGYTNQVASYDYNGYQKSYP